jgi:hypothetical protein
LREAGARGVSSSELLFEYRIMRPGSRAYDLRKSGFDLETREGPGGTAIYVLKVEPAAPRPLPSYSRKLRPQQESLFAEAL